jgi:hypothetical protein
MQKHMIKGSITRSFRLDEFRKRTLKEIDDALYAVGTRVLNDVEFGNGAVMVPLDEGTLSGSAHIAIQGQDTLFLENLSVTGASGDKSQVTTPDTMGIPKQGMRISYNTSYAEDVHENYKDRYPGEASIQKFGSDDSERFGYKFLERTFLGNMGSYVKLFAEFMRDGIKRS